MGLDSYKVLYWLGDEAGDGNYSASPFTRDHILPEHVFERTLQCSPETPQAEVDRRCRA